MVFSHRYITHMTYYGKLIIKSWGRGICMCEWGSYALLVACCSSSWLASCMAESECTDADDIQLVDKPGTSSKVWEFFWLHLVSNGQPMKDGKVICHICHCDIAAKSGNTSNLISHHHKHPIMYSASNLVVPLLWFLLMLTKFSVKRYYQPR